MDMYAIVTDKIIELLETGVVPWRRPWTSAGLPRNLVSKKPYHGQNVFLLSASKYVSPFWLTLRQANQLGGHVHKGEESTVVIYWKIEDSKRSAKDLDIDENDEKNRRRFLLKHYRVFNLEQCELPQSILDKLPKTETHEHAPIIIPRESVQTSAGSLFTRMTAIPRRRTAQRSVNRRTRTPARLSIGGARTGPTAIDG
jgi:antirestriction protein ArdC